MDRDHILARLRERIVAFAALRVSRESAQDIAQDVLLLLHEKYRHVERIEELLPLSLQIARFKILDYHRKALRRGEYNQERIEKLELADAHANPELAAEHAQLLERLMKAIDSLGARCRKLFRLKLEGQTFAEIQQSLGLRSINTVYTWDFRCRKELLQLMGGSWEEADNQVGLENERRRH